MPIHLAFGLFAAAGVLVEATVGFGGALVSVPLFALVMSPREAVPAYLMLVVLMEAILVCESHPHVDWRGVSRLLVGALVGVPLGALGLRYLPTDTIRIVVSAVTLLFAASFLFGVAPRIPDHLGTRLATGLTSGFLGGLIAVSGPPVVIFALSQDWRKDAFRASLLAYFLAIALIGVGSYLCLGMVHRSTLLLLTAGVAGAFPAAGLGVLLKRRIPEAAFRSLVLVVIVAVSLVGLVHH